MEDGLIIQLIFIFGIAALMFASGVVILYWCYKNGQFKNLEKGSRCIFTEEEPEGVETDFFPGRGGDYLRQQNPKIGE